jgi:hypothetical protein
MPNLSFSRRHGSISRFAMLVRSWFQCTKRVINFFGNCEESFPQEPQRIVLLTPFSTNLLAE